MWGGQGGLLTHGFSFAFLLDPHFFASSLFQMSVNARRHRLYSCLGGLVGYDVIASRATSLLHTQKVASSSLASSTFFFLATPPMPLRRPTALFGRLCKENFRKSCSEPVLPFARLQTPAKCKGGGASLKVQKKIGDNTDLCIFRI